MFVTRNEGTRHNMRDMYAFIHNATRSFPVDARFVGVTPVTLTIDCSSEITLIPYPPFRRTFL